MSNTVEDLRKVAGRLESDGYIVSAAIIVQGAKELEVARDLVEKAYNPETGLIALAKNGE
ncbi:MAG: hypothetical protein QQN63_04085 [Nitrosopumilus sp.]